jgi:Secretion system C-terminal sorting domain
LRSLNSQENGIYLSETFPNPADAVMNVVVKESDDVVRIELNDLSGRNVYSSIYSQENGQLHWIDCSNYASGMYILKVYSGTHIEQHNIAIQHR